MLCKPNPTESHPQRKCPGPLGSERGFTLIEVLVAIVVFALGVLALNRLQIATISSNSLASQLNTATNLAHDKMDTLLNLAYSHPDLDDSNGNGTGQDSDSDMIDNDDDGTSSDGFSFFGLNDTVVKTSPAALAADHTQSAATTLTTYTIYWNIAVDQPITNSKAIRVLVQWRDKRNILHSIALDGTKGLSY